MYITVCRNSVQELSLHSGKSEKYNIMKLLGPNGEKHVPH